MAFYNKANALKALLLIIAAVVFIVFNVINNREDDRNTFFSFSHSSNSNSNLEITHTSNSGHEHNVYTLILGSDNTTIKDVRFNTHNSSFHKSETLVIESSDFKRTFGSTNNNTIDYNLLATSHNNHSNNVKISTDNQTCPSLPPNLNGPYQVDTEPESIESIELKLSTYLEAGGLYKTKECISRYHVAIVVPFRDRYVHLPIFLKNIHKFLMKQQIEYQIFVIEQTNGKAFNRAALMNIGFLEALKVYPWDCFIFHDVDLLPLDDRNLYRCPDQPRHMSVAIDIFGFRLPYSSIFGGVSSMTTKQFKAVNGFSNSFWGWGGEDDDMSNRLKHANFHISRYPINIARYMMLNHKKEKANPKRYENLANGVKKFMSDGINSVKYEVYSYKKLPLFSWYLVELKITEP